MKEQIYVAWRHPIKRSWHPVGLLYRDDNLYHFVYTKGALTSGFPLFPRMSKIGEYHSSELFPLFGNRIMSEKRPDYKNYFKWLNIKPGEASPLKMLGLTEGIKPTDHLEFFQCPVKSNDNQYKVTFTLHGLQYFPTNVIQRVNELKEGERLYLVPDPQNEWDRNAIMLRTSDPVYSIGYCPRYLSQDFSALLKNANVDNVKVSVKKVNKDAPLSLRLLCQIVAPWPVGFRPCGQEDFTPLIGELGLFENKTVDTGRLLVN